MEKSKISYSAVMLDDRSKERLVRKFQSMIPEGWEIVDDMHMTINMGKINDDALKYLGFPVRISAVSIAMDDKVIAAGVTGFDSKNERPHITIAVNKRNGAKAFMSNNLTRWDRINRPLQLVGVVKEVLHPIYNTNPQDDFSKKIKKDMTRDLESDELK